ncbi:hypothetical protein C8R44DRAFT_959124, partial [Mycena epipterygia]
MRCTKFAATITKFGCAVLKNRGPGEVMPNEVLQRIVDCANFAKIGSTDQLVRETRWVGATEFGAAVVALIQEHRVIPVTPALLTSTPLAVRSNDSETPFFRSIQARKCSKCHTAGHIASNKKCPFHPQHQPEPSEPSAPSTWMDSSSHHPEDENTEPQELIPITTSIEPGPSAPRPVPHPLYGQYRIPYTPTAPPSLAGTLWAPNPA